MTSENRRDLWIVIGILVVVLFAAAIIFGEDFESWIWGQGP